MIIPARGAAKRNPAWLGRSHESPGCNRFSSPGSAYSFALMGIRPDRQAVPPDPRRAADRTAVGVFYTCSPGFDASVITLNAS